MRLLPMRQLTTQLYQFRGLAQTASGNSEKKSQQMDPTVVSRKMHRPSFPPRRHMIASSRQRDSQRPSHRRESHHLTQNVNYEDVTPMCTNV